MTSYSSGRTSLTVATQSPARSISTGRAPPACSSRALKATVQRRCSPGAGLAARNRGAPPIITASAMVAMTFDVSVSLLLFMARPLLRYYRRVYIRATDEITCTVMVADPSAFPLLSVVVMVTVYVPGVGRAAPGQVACDSLLGSG